MKIGKLQSGIVDDLNRLLDVPEILDVLDPFRQCGAQIAVYAGAVRDTLLWHEWGLEECRPRDIDIGICRVRRTAFDGLMKELGAERNRYGGYKLRRQRGLKLEFWRLEDTIGLRLTRTAKISIENVLRSFVLDCNAIAYDPFREELYDLGSQRAIHTRTVSILRNALVHSRPTFAAKALALRLRFGFRWSRETEAMVERSCDSRALKHELTKVLLSANICQSLTDMSDEFNRSKYEHRRLSSVAQSALDCLCSLQS